MRTPGTLLGYVFVVLLALLGGACAPELCRFDPYCNGGIGAFCDGDRDCRDGFCCTTGNCGGGMCTLACDSDVDCPEEMACEHDVCFFRCVEGLGRNAGHRAERVS